MATSCLFHISMKNAFLVAIPLACNIVEIGALMADSPTPITVFFKNKVSVHPHPKLLAMVLSEFHLNQFICQCIFRKCINSLQETYFHTLDVRRVLTFCLDRLRQFQKSARLFISFSNSWSPQSLLRDFWDGFLGVLSFVKMQLVFIPPKCDSTFYTSNIHSIIQEHVSIWDI